ncbi:hypothetical protein Ae201684P_004912 [Aphanomyces euteiches]|nr:hypothetical protein Ae201684P_004912 [Aphanomyces euteiches]
MVVCLWRTSNATTASSRVCPSQLMALRRADAVGSWPVKLSIGSTVDATAMWRPTNRWRKFDDVDSGAAQGAEINRLSRSKMTQAHRKYSAKSTSFLSKLVNH